MIKRLIIYALILMQTSDKVVIYDINGSSTYHDSADVLVFSYSYRDFQREIEIEVTESGGYSDPERLPADETTENRTETFTLSPEMSKALDYWNTFNCMSHFILFII